MNFTVQMIDMSQPNLAKRPNSQSDSQSEWAESKLIVLKYGGMSLCSADHVKRAAEHVAELATQGYRVMAVVSAMGKTTDELLSLAYSVSSQPNRRELDMLLSTGERVSMALFSMALTDSIAKRGGQAKAISFTGSQAGILTSDTHSNAAIIDVRPVRVQEELDKGNVVILAGFQGVSPTTKEITTLGRGGTDVTAVAMAIALGAVQCEILKEVPGVMTADPKVVPTAKVIAHLTHAQLLDMTFWGAKVLHYRSVELAAKASLPIVVRLAHTSDSQSATSVFSLVQSTEVLPDGGSRTMTPQSTFEKSEILAVNSHSRVLKLTVKGPGSNKNSLSSAYKIMQSALSSASLPVPLILNSQAVNGQTAKAQAAEDAVEFLITGPAEVLEAQNQLFKQPQNATTFEVAAEALASVTATCNGAAATALQQHLLEAIETHPEIQVTRVLIGTQSLTFLVPADTATLTIQTLHAFISKMPVF